MAGAGTPSATQKVFNHTFQPRLRSLVATGGMRKWTVSAQSAERGSIIKPTDAERVKLRAKVFTRWVANRGRRAEDEQGPNGAAR